MTVAFCRYISLYTTQMWYIRLCTHTHVLYCRYSFLFFSLLSKVTSTLLKLQIENQPCEECLCSSLCEEKNSNDMHNTVTEYTSSFVHENHTRMTNESVQSVTVLQGHSFCRGQTETLHLIITDACLLLLCVLNIRMQTRQCVCVCVCFGVWESVVFTNFIIKAIYTTQNNNWIPLLFHIT